jgi:sugar lactone lactonase YvrE
MKPAVEVAVPAKAQLGEGPTWDAAGARLLWVDIMRGEVHSYDPDTGADTLVKRTGQHVGAAKPRAGGGLVVNLRDGIGLYDTDGSFRMLADLATDGVRGNDAAVAPDGSLWAGTMRYDKRPGGGRLYRISPHGDVTTVLDEVTISNGTGWSPDGRLMYYIDTPTRRIDVFDVDGPAIHDRRTFVDVDGAGFPDGLTVDADGCVWTALWDGGQVRRYAPSGRLDRSIEIPAARTTACAFGGPDLRDLYITSARSDDPADAEPVDEPADDSAGFVFVVRDIGQGLPCRAFAG